MPPKQDIVGQKFGRLVVLNESQRAGSVTKWKCVCDCGKQVYVYRGKLISGHTKSCGCIVETLQGLSKHRLYKTWWGIKERCNSPKSTNYFNYGAKGITMNQGWNDFKTFYDWAMNHGYEDTLTIDRINSKGNYEPANCRWITLADNVARANVEKAKRKSKFVYFGISPIGERHQFANAEEFADEHNLVGNSIRRVARGERTSYKRWKFGFTDIPNT